jgi:hypothetical protein
VVAPASTALPRRKRRRPLVVVGLVVSLILIAGGGVYTWNYVGLQSPMNEVLAGDSRNEGISVSVHHEYYLSPSTIVFDVQNIGSGRSRADMFRVLLQFASKMKGESFDKVLLASAGTVKFVLDGDYFKQLGQEFGTQNPVYTMRTFPSRVKRPDGSVAYGEWTGGLLGVASKQLEDFGNFFDRWLVLD